MNFTGPFSPLSYQDKLRLQGQQESLRLELSNQTQALIADNQQLSAAGLAVLSQTGDKIAIALSQQTQELASAVAELDWTFRWGFNEVLASIENLNASVQRLVEIGANPSQTWAYEQFTIANDAYSRGLTADALEYVSRAINGYGSQAGYRLEHRFHFLLGLIRLGDHRGPTHPAIDLQLAEHAFHESAKYARSAKEAARAELAAGWAAYCRGDLPAADQATSQAIHHNPGLAQAHYQLGKIRAASNLPSDALNHLGQACIIEMHYILKASSDEDYLRFEPDLRDFISQWLEQYRNACLKEMNRLNPLMIALSEITASAPARNTATDLWTTASTSYATQTLFGYASAFQNLFSLSTRLLEVATQLEAHCKSRKTTLSSERESKLTSVTGHAARGRR